MRLGFHISVAGGLLKSLERVTELNCQTIQIFNGSPRNWEILSTTQDEIVEFKKKRKTFRIFPLFVHTPYLINLSSPVKKDWEKSKEYFVKEIEFAHVINAEYLVTHLGNHKGKGIKYGVKRVAEALKFFLTRVKSTSFKILLENTAGEGTSVGYELEQISRIINSIGNSKKIGFCLDTAHAFAAGYKINNPRGWKKFINQLEKLELLEKVGLIHLNDSKTNLASRIDRHEHIGKGKIGKEGFKVILNSPLLKEKSIIMETPKKSIQDDFKNLTTVVNLIE